MNHTNASKTILPPGQYGEIEHINLKHDPMTGRSRGFAFIVFKVFWLGDHVLIYRVLCGEYFEQILRGQLRCRWLSDVWSPLYRRSRDWRPPVLKRRTWSRGRGWEQWTPRKFTFYCFESLLRQATCKKAEVRQGKIYVGRLPVEDLSNQELTDHFGQVELSWLLEWSWFLVHSSASLEM